MEKYYIKLKKGESGSLGEVIARHLKTGLDEAETLIRYGSVWNGNKRLKDAAFRITTETLVVHRPKYKVNPYPFEAEDIIYEDKWMFILYKKPWFPTVPTPYADINSLSHGLNTYLQKNRPGEEAFVINRLDLATMGLVIYVRKKEVEGRFHTLFQSRNIKKWYMVKTDLPGPNEPPLKSRYIIEDELTWKEKIKTAKTVIFPLEAKEGFQYFLALPKTGRTHQIRKHFAQYIRPIYGDATYGTYSKYDMMGLCCFYYSFRHPVTGQKIKVKYLPPAFCETGLQEPQSLLNNLRSSS